MDKEELKLKVVDGKTIFRKYLKKGLLEKIFYCQKKYLDKKVETLLFKVLLTTCVALLFPKWNKESSDK